jgi:UPF0716 protein FxsA
MIGVPIVEIAVFIEVGGRLGLWPTLATIILTAMAGTALLRQQGLATLQRVRESLEANRFPMAEVFDGLCLLVAGALLLTPGFVTDAAGLLLFVPAVRVALRQAFGRYLVASGRLDAWTEKPGPFAPGGGDTVIDGEYHEVPPENAAGNNGDDTDQPPPVIGPR